MSTENGTVVKEDRYASPVRNLVLDGAGSNYVVPPILSHVSSNGEKNQGEPWDGDAYLYTAIIPWTYGATMSNALWYKKMNGDCSCQECKRWCRFWCGKVMEREWNCLMVYTTAHYIRNDGSFPSGLLTPRPPQLTNCQLSTRFPCTIALTPFYRRKCHDAGDV